MGVKHILLVMAVVMGQSVLAADKKPLITKTSVEAKKPQPPEAVPEKLIAETRRFGGSKSEISE